MLKSYTLTGKETQQQLIHLAIMGLISSKVLATTLKVDVKKVNIYLTKAIQDYQYIIADCIKNLGLD